jgi:hypothetical protein
VAPAAVAGRGGAGGVAHGGRVAGAGRSVRMRPPSGRCGRSRSSSPRCECSGASTTCRSRSEVEVVLTNDEPTRFRAVVAEGVWSGAWPGVDESLGTAVTTGRAPAPTPSCAAGAELSSRWRTSSTWTGSGAGSGRSWTGSRACWRRHREAAGERAVREPGAGGRGGAGAGEGGQLPRPAGAAVPEARGADVRPGPPGPGCVAAAAVACAQPGSRRAARSTTPPRVVEVSPAPFDTTPRPAPPW